MSWFYRGVYVVRMTVVPRPLCALIAHAQIEHVQSQVAKANGGHKKNVWEIMRCPEYALKCNKSVHLPA